MLDLDDKNIVSTDVEATGLNPYKADRPFALSFCFSDNTTKYFNWRVDPFTRQVQKPNKAQLSFIRSILCDPKIPKLGHNIMYDCGMMERAWDIKVEGPIHDSMFMAHACNPLEFTLGLKALSKKYHKIPDDDEKRLHDLTIAARRYGKKEGWALGPVVQTDYWMPILLAKNEAEILACQEYCTLDTQRSLMLARMYWQVFQKDRHAADVYEREHRLWWTTKRMQNIGVRVDLDIVRKELAWCKTQQAALRTRLEAVFGPFEKKVSDERMRAYLYGPKPKGLGLIPSPDHLTEKTKLPSVAKEVLELLAFDVPIVSAKMEMDRISKARTTYFENYLNDAALSGGVWTIHANFDQIGARTGRFSCREPNLQNCPKRGKAGDIMQRVRAPFGPRPGCIWLHLDYKGIEARIFAEEANEPDMLRIFEAGGDVYQDLVHRIERLTALDLVRLFVHRDSPGKPGSGARDICKITHLAWMYGEGKEKMQKSMRLPSLKMAERIITAMKDAYPQAQPFMWKMSKQAERNKFIINRYGRKIPIPKPMWDKKNGKWIEFWYKATNYLIQGTAADMMKSAMPLCEAYLQTPAGLGGKMLMTIHDELVFEFPKAKLGIKQVNSLSKIMQDAAEQHYRRVRFPVDSSITRSHWSTPEKAVFQ